MSSHKPSHTVPEEDLPRLWRTLLDALPNGVVVTLSEPPDHPVVYANPAFEELTGYSLDEVRGRDLRFLQGDDTSQPGVVQVRQALAAGEGTRALLRNYTRDGQLFWNEMTLSPLPGEEGSPDYVLGILRDRTSVQQAEEERRQSADLRESAQRLQQVAEHLDEAVWLLDRAAGSPGAGQILYRNPGFGELWDQPGGDGGDWLSAVHPDDRQRAASLVPSDAARAQEPREAEFRLGNRALGDEERWLKGRSFAILDDHGQAVRRVILAQDISQHRRVEEQLRRANQALANTVQELAQRNLQMLALNETVDHLQNCTTSQEAEAAVAECVPEIFRQEAGAVYLLDDDHNLQPLVVWGDSPPRDEAFPVGHCEALRRGREFWTEASYPPVRCRHSRPTPGVSELCLALRSHGTVLGLLHVRVMVGDSSEEQEVKASVLRFAINVAEQIALGLSNIRLRERLHTQAVEDPLTGLYNRRFFNDALERELRRAIRRDSPLSLLMLDLDHFKRVNDRWGHDAGDRLLQRLARLLRTSVRAEDVVARYGGEEFMVLLPDTDLAAAGLLAERLRETFHEQESAHRPVDSPPVTLSAGIAGRPDSGHTAEALLRAADIALYRAKRQGRNRVETVTSLVGPSASS